MDENARTPADIDLDPASCAHAQETVRAARYFTKADNGLAHDWRGRVWLNPPYSHPAIVQFIEKLVAEVKAGTVAEAVLLTNNYTDTGWFHHAEAAAAAICFTKGRIKFESPDGDQAAPVNGQAFFYFGARPARFREVFSGVGFVR
jgi:phage N-6-adenine-methyltransferase